MLLRGKSWVKRLHLLASCAKPAAGIRYHERLCAPPRYTLHRLFMKSRRLWIILAFVALALAAGVYYWQQQKAKAALPDVLTAPVARGTLEDAVLASGTIEATKLINVGAQVSGQVKRLYVKLGDSVKQGQLVAEIDSATQNNSVKDAEAQLAAAKAALASKQATFGKAERDLAQQQALAKQGFIAQSALVQFQTSLDTARADVAAAQAQIEQFAVRAQTAQTNLGYTRITAPMDGVVVAIVTDEGMTLNANQTAPTIIKLADLSTMTIEAQISEADVPRVRPGMAATFTLLGDPDKRYNASLRAIEPGPVDMATSTGQTSSGGNTNAIYYNGLLDVPNPDGKLRISMTAQVSITLQKEENALLIPASVLGRRAKDGSYTVRVATGDKGAQQISERKIHIGLNNRVQAQVLDGLKEGEQLVVGDAAQGSGAGSGGRRGVRMF
jgi:macrolide-specific efflux system membrane fusion protein